jgi:N-acetylneuraminic acid mutarotase
MKVKALFFLILIVMVLLTAFACQKESADPDPVPEPAPWQRRAAFSGAAVRGAAAFSIGTNAYIVSGINFNQLTAQVYQYDSTANTWSRKNDFPGVARLDAGGFAVGGKGYVCLGSDNVGFLGDIWEYDPQTDGWTKKENFPGNARMLSTVLVIRQRAYIIGGGSINLRNKDVWEFDPQTDSWARKSDFPGEGFNGYAGFVIDNKGYLYLGSTNSSSSVTKFELWEYDPANDSWTRKADFPGASRGYALAFSLGNKGYLGLGAQTEEPLPMIVPLDFWEYDPQGNSWSRQADFPAAGRSMAVSFAIGSLGYVGLGADSMMQDLGDMWSFTPRQ